MTLLLVFLIALCFWRLEIPGYHGDFLSVANTIPIKGIFTFLVLFSHMRGYLSLESSWMNSLYFTVQDHLGQLIVAMFLFYSGFGIWESYKSKANYKQTFFRQRFLKTLAHFDLIVLLLILVQLFIPKIYSPREYLLCWIGWKSVGNDNWFIFDILALYLFSTIALHIQNKPGGGAGLGIVVILTTLFWIFLRWAGKESYWFNTLAAFPLGMLFSLRKTPFLSLLSKRGMPYLLTCLSAVVFFTFKKIWGGVDAYGFTTCAFCCFVTVLFSWIKIGNPVLNWAGKNVFTIYMLQRLPMLMLASMGINEKPALFIFLSCLLTFVLAECFSRLLKKIDTFVFHA